MALVAYDNSDSSEYEDEDDESITVIPSNKPDGNSCTETTKLKPDNTVFSTEGNLFNLLPQPSSKGPTIVEEDDEFLHKKENVANVVKPKAQITVPSLSDFKDVESTTRNTKPRPINAKNSGLLSILPEPKNGISFSTKSLIPNVLTQKTNISHFKNKQIPEKFLKKPNTKPSMNDNSDESDTEQVENDFFSINKPVNMIKEASNEIDQINAASNASYKKPFHTELYLQVNSNEADKEQGDFTGGSSMDYNTEESCSNRSNEPDLQIGEMAIDEEAIIKLCGTRAKRKREEIQIVNVNQKEVLADAKEWLLKGLMDDTSKRVSASKKKGHEPTNQQKRKHQITYLAYQAKANEVDLQNQWANNKMSKKQTQSKYGF